MSSELINLSGFRTAVDRTPDTIITFQDDLKRLYKHFDLVPEPELSKEVVGDELYARIGSAFVTDHLIIERHCKKILHQLIVEHVLHGKPLEPYLEIVSCIQDAIRKPSAESPASDNWNTAICAAHDFVRLFPWRMDDENKKKLYIRDFEVAYAAKRLQENGFQIAIQNYRPVLRDDEIDRIVARLDHLVRKIGGINVAGKIFSDIEDRYDPVQQRYHLVRRVNPLGNGIAPRIPYGYLLLLAAKYPFSQPEDGLLRGKDWRGLIAISTDFAAIYNVQPYSTFELTFNQYGKLLPFLRDLALYDSLFTIPQLRPPDSIKIIRGTLDWLDWDKEYDNSWTLAEAAVVANEILSIGKDHHGPVCFPLKELISRCKAVSPKQIKWMMENIFSHPPPGANQGYTVPTVTPGPDFFKRPLLSDGRGVYCLLDVSACAAGVIEALLTLLREAHTDIDDRLGKVIEEFLKTEFAAHNISIVSGEYTACGEKGECDLVVETPDTILFFEVKKKALTRKARAGSDIDILIDLAKSLLYAQLQAGRHEVRLRTLGYLDLEDDRGNINRIELSGRDIERIAVTFLDHGSFQDRMILQQFLATNLSALYTSADLGLQEKLDNLKIKLAEFRELYEKIASLDDRRRKNPFFHCWFLSLPQILILLDSVNSNEDLKDALWTTRYMSTGSLDFYYDYSTAIKLRKG